jgi:hypothetical protein
MGAISALRMRLQALFSSQLRRKGGSMSETQQRFIDLALNGSVLADDIDDFIDNWHDNDSGETLHDYLGLTWQEYSLWVSDASYLSLILSARHRNRPLIDAVNDNVLATRQNFVGAERSMRASQLQSWLGQQGTAR